MRRLLLLTAVPLLLGAGPCSTDREGLLEGEGVVHQGVGPECPQQWHVRTSDGRMLWPVNDAAYQQEGLRVGYSARERGDMASICMAGTMVEFVSLRKL